MLPHLSYSQPTFKLTLKHANLTPCFFFFKDQDNQKKTPESPMQSNNSIMSNNQMSQMSQMSQQHQHHHQQLQQQLQAHLSGGYMMSNGMSGSGVGGSGNIVGNNIMLSELPEPPISVSEIGPIPPPPMFSTPSPTMISGRAHGPGVHGMSHHDYDYDGELKFFTIQSFMKLT